MKTYQTYLFDWDGCLMNTPPVVLESYQAAFAHFDLHPSTNQIISVCFGDWDGPIKLGIESPQLPEFNKILLAGIKSRHSELKLHPNVMSVLDHLKKNSANIAIVSTAIRQPIEELIITHHIEKYIDIIIAAEDVKSHKPDPEGIHQAMKFFGSSPESTVMIGDSPKDIQAGKNADIDTIAFYPTINQDFYQKRELSDLNPTYIIDDMSELLEKNS